MPIYVPTESFQLAVPPIDPMTGDPVGSNIKSTLRSDLPVSSISVDSDPHSATFGLMFLLGDFSWTPAMAANQIGDQLLKSGWTLTTGNTLGTGQISMPLYTGSALGQVALGIYIPGYGGVVIKGPISSFGGLVTNIQDFFGSAVTVSAGLDAGGHQTVFLQANTPDPIFNSPYLFAPLGSGIPALDGNPSPFALNGSGFQYASLPANKTASSAGSQLTVSIAINNVRSITFGFGGSYLDAISTAGTANPQYNLFLGTLGGGIVPAGVVPAGTFQPSYTVITSGYQFAIVDDNNTIDFAGAFDYGGNSILACAPFVDPAVMPNLKTSMFVVGPGMLKNNMTWNAGGLGSYAVNGDYVTFQGTQLSQNGMLTFIYPSADPVLTSNSKPIFINPHALYSPGLAFEGTVNGQVWWGLVLTQAGFPTGSEQIFNTPDGGYYFHLISQQTIPEPCSLWIAFQ